MNKIHEMTEDEIITNLNDRDFPLFGSLEYLSPEQQTDRVITVAISVQVYNYSFIEEDKKTDEVTRLVLNKMGYPVTDGETMEEQLIKVLKSGCSIFPSLPERSRTKNVCEVAARQGYWNLPGIPKDILTRKMCFDAIDTISMFSNKLESLRVIPYPEVCMAILERNGKEIGAYKLAKNFNPEAINSDVANQALRQDLRCIACIPEGVQHDITLSEQEIRDIKFISKDSEYVNKFERLPDERKTENVCFVAVGIVPFNLDRVPKTSRSDRVIEKALEMDGNALLCLPVEERTDARQLLAIKNMRRDSVDLFEQFPDRLKTEEICRHAATRCPATLDNIPLELLTPDVCQAAISTITNYEEEIEILCLIPHKNVIYNNLGKLECYYPVMQIMQAMEPEQLDDKIISWAIKRDEKCFANIPKELLTPEHCLLQEKYYPGYFVRYPGELPERIRDGNNIYTFYPRAEKFMGMNLSPEQLAALYNGVPLGKDKKVVYDSETGVFSINHQNQNHKHKLR